MKERFSLIFGIFKELSGKEMRSERQKLFPIINFLSVPNDECEGGFSTMNVICTSRITET